MPTGHSDIIRLVADIGGTNARFALLYSNDRTPAQEQVLPCADYPDPVAAIEQYLSQVGSVRPQEAALALATPVTGDRVKMTNHVWAFSLEETRSRVGLDRLLALNDFTAQAMAVPHLDAADLHAIGQGESVPGTPIGVIGPGTGLGVSGLIPAAEQWIPLQGEGGHVTFSPSTEREIEILKLVREHFEHVSAERLVSGSLGFGAPDRIGSLHRAIAMLHGFQPSPLSAAEIVERARSGVSEVCIEVVDTFCSMLGTAAGNLALTLGARGGVYIAGGIVPRLGDLFDRSPFRQRFEQKGRFDDYMARIPTYVVKASHPALLGLAWSFDTPLANFLVVEQS